MTQVVCLSRTPYVFVHTPTESPYVSPSGTSQGGVALRIRPCMGPLRRCAARGVLQSRCSPSHEPLQLQSEMTGIPAQPIVRAKWRHDRESIRSPEETPSRSGIEDRIHPQAYHKFQRTAQSAFIVEKRRITPFSSPFSSPVSPSLSLLTSSHPSRLTNLEFKGSLKDCRRHLRSHA